MRRVTIFTIGCLLLAAPAMAQTKAQIQQLEDQWGAAFNKGDAAAVTAMYTPDAYVLPAGSPMAHGHDAIQAFWTKAMEAIGDVKCTTVDVKPLGGPVVAVREIGTCTFKTKGQSPQDGALKYTVLWHKGGSRWQPTWKLNTDIWNTDK